MAILAGLGVLMLLLVVLVGSALLNGWALSVLWGWFFVPILGLPALGIAQAIGIALVISCLTGGYEPEAKEENPFARRIAFAVCRPIIAVGMGWVVKQFMVGA